MPTTRFRLASAVFLVIAIGCKKDATGPAEQEPVYPPFYSSPVEVSSELVFARVGAGYFHTCGITRCSAHLRPGHRRPRLVLGRDQYGQVGRPGSETTHSLMEGP